MLSLAEGRAALLQVLYLAIESILAMRSSSVRLAFATDHLRLKMKLTNVGSKVDLLMSQHRHVPYVK